MGDLIDEFFDPEFYPGSRRKRHAAPVDKEPEPWRKKYTTKWFNGREVRMYAIGPFAEALGVSVPTVRHWVRKGHIPDSPYRLPKNMIAQGERIAGRRLYTEELIDATVEILDRYGLRGRNVPWSDRDYMDLPDQIAEAWKRVIGRSDTNTDTHA